MKKKILLIITQSEFGGAQRFLAHLIDGLRRDTQIVLTSQDTQKHTEKSASISVSSTESRIAGHSYPQAGLTLL